MVQEPIIIFGAALQRNGRPHRVLIERVQTAISYGRKCVSPLYIPTGGKPQSGFTEAKIMQDLLLEAQIPSEQILCENQANNTLESVKLCSSMLETRGFRPKRDKIILVSSAYHCPRCWWLMRLMGWQAQAIAVNSSSASSCFMKRWKWRLREFPAIIWDSFCFFIKI